MRDTILSIVRRSALYTAFGSRACISRSSKTFDPKISFADVLEKSSAASVDRIGSRRSST